LNLFGGLLSKKSETSEGNRFAFFINEELTRFFTDSSSDDKIEQPQKEMLEDALEFNKQKARNVMIPRIDIIAIPENMNISEILDLAKNEGYTRYPVYGENLDEITGILIIYDLIPKMNNKDLIAKDLKREAFFAPETMDLDNLLREMQQKKKSMAIIVDSYGGTSGIVTIEDIPP
jgi:CBS domain containing-hemolysin-like protein